MTTITVPINNEIEKFINQEISEGRAESKAHLVRYALMRLQTDRSMLDLMEAEDDIKTGKVYKGDLKTILKKMK